MLLNIQSIILDGVEWDFMLEIISRTLLMFLIILLVLRLSGRRGVRQLTLFEVAIILGMGSAAGDPMFQDDIPILYGFIVLLTILLFYKLVTWLTRKSTWFNVVLEGKPMCIVKDGMFEIKTENDSDFSKMEFFAELRNHSVEHLGQVRTALLEVDGSMSLLYYPKDDRRYGLPLFPGQYEKIDPTLHSGPFACMFCGKVLERVETDHAACPRCDKKDWTLAINVGRDS